MKVIVYGAPICGDCVAVKEQVKDHKELTVDYRDITSSTALMREFLQYRDNEPMFDQIKKDGRIGIPFFILEDGTKTFELGNYVELKEVERPINACSIDGKNC